MKKLSLEYRIALMFVIAGAMTAVGALFPMTAMASFTSAGSQFSNGNFAYDVYNVVVNQILKGPIGFVGGIFMVAIGALTFPKSWPAGLATAVSGGAMLKADTIVQSMGTLV